MMINDEDFTDEQLLLTTVQAARVLGIGRTGVYALMKEGLLHPVYLGRSCRISWAELERFIACLESDEPERPRPGRPRALRVWRRLLDESGALRMMALEIRGSGDDSAA
jgi:excisionase family DNA binding protein